MTRGSDDANRSGYKIDWGDGTVSAGIGNISQTPVLDFDALLADDGSPETWESGPLNATLSGATLNTSVVSTQGITHAYQFDGTGGGQLPSLSSLPGDPTTQSAAWEVVFRPNDLVGNEILFEHGSGPHGVSLNIEQATNGYRVVLAISEGGVSRIIRSETISDVTRFVNATGVWNQDADTIQLLIDGQPTSAPLDSTGFSDWGGNNGSANNAAAIGTRSNASKRARRECRGFIRILKFPRRDRIGPVCSIDESRI